MNKKEQIKILKDQIAYSVELDTMAEQMKAKAARIGSEAKRALDSLGATPERTRKGPSEEFKSKLRLTGFPVARK